MTIRTQQTQVANVCFPIAEAAGPNVMAVAGAKFGRRVNVVDIQGAVIREATIDTFTAQRFDQREFSFPIAGALVNSIAMFVPILPLARCVAKARRTLSATLSAFARLLPSRRQIAGLIAVLARSFAETMGVHLHRGLTPSAGDRDRRCSHGFIVTHEPKYFDIACRRVQAAVDEPRLPGLDAAPAAKQETML